MLPDECATVPRISLVAVCCSRASASSRVSALTCCCRSARVELAGRASAGALLGLSLVVLPRRVFAGLRFLVRGRLTEPSPGPTIIRYHIVRSFVHHSKIHQDSTAAAPAIILRRDSSLMFRSLIE